MLQRVHYSKLSHRATCYRLVQEVLGSSSVLEITYIAHACHMWSLGQFVISRKQKSKNLSGGMQHRLSVAMACFGNPDLDEPITGLGATSKVWDIMGWSEVNGYCGDGLWCCS